MKYKKVVKTIYLKGEDFVPESLIVEPSDEVRFLNENRNAATIQSKGSLSIADFTLGFGKERTIALENEGRFLFHSAADTSITVINITIHVYHDKYYLNPLFRSVLLKSRKQLRRNRNHSL